MPTPEYSKEIKIAIIGNNYGAAETVWLAAAIEKKTKLGFDMGDRVVIGILIALGVYNYLVLDVMGKERVLNKAWVREITAP